MGLICRKGPSWSWSIETKYYFIYLTCINCTSVNSEHKSWSQLRRFDLRQVLLYNEYPVFDTNSQFVDNCKQEYTVCNRLNIEFLWKFMQCLHYSFVHCWLIYIWKHVVQRYSFLIVKDGNDRSTIVLINKFLWIQIEK